MKFQPGQYLPGGPLTTWQLTASLLPFAAVLLFLASGSTIVRSSPWLLGVLVLPVLALLVVLWVVGVARQLPLWALPGLGALLFFPSAFVQLSIQSLVFMSMMAPLYGGWPEQVSLKIALALLIQAICLVVMAGLAAGVTLLFPRFREQVQQEWTLLSYLLYGMAILPVLGNDEFHGIAGYETASLLILLAGALMYLTVPRRWQRVLALLVPVVLSPALMSLGLYLVFPAQSWATPQVTPFRVWEALQPVLYLAYLPFLLLLAALAPRLPWARREQALPPPASPTTG
jgi:hypothetical protein